MPQNTQQTTLDGRSRRGRPPQQPVIIVTHALAAHCPAMATVLLELQTTASRAHNARTHARTHTAHKNTQTVERTEIRGRDATRRSIESRRRQRRHMFRSESMVILNRFHAFTPPQRATRTHSHSNSSRTHTHGRIHDDDAAPHLNSTRCARARAKICKRWFRLKYARTFLMSHGARNGNVSHTRTVVVSVVARCYGRVASARTELATVVVVVVVCASRYHII